MDAGDGALVRFARELRLLREKAGTPTYRELGALAHYSAAALSEAAGGRKLPSLSVTVAYVKACGGDTAEWEMRWRATAAELAAATIDEPDETALAPYVGLAAFQPSDAGRFFGRDELTAEVLTRLRQRRFLGIFGASGCGKSSLLRAGLVARLSRQEPNHDHVVVFTPGRHPIAECAVQLAGFLDAPPGTLRDEFMADPANLHLRIRQAMIGFPAESDVVLVVDQFEELFTVCDDERERAGFVDALVIAATDPASRARVVAGVRADFLGHCGRYPLLVRALRDAQVLVGPMTTEELRLAITRPAERVGCRVETALVARLIADATGQPGVLPLISHALLQTWLRRQGTVMTVAAYDGVGGIEHALARSAEEVFTSLPVHEQAIAKQILLRLVAMGVGTEDTKRRIALHELDDDAQLVLDKLTAARLITLGQNSAEISHEALIRHWPRLRGWLAEDRDGQQTHRRLVEATENWKSVHRDRGALLRGTPLAVTQEWSRTAKPALTPDEREFLTTSIRHRHRTTVTRRLAIACLALLTLVAGTTAVWALRQRDDAEFRQVLAEADRLMETDPSLAATLYLAAEKMRPDDAEVSARLAESQHSPLATVLNGHNGDVYMASFSPDGRTLATASYDRTVRLWDVRDRTRAAAIGQPLTGHSSWVTSAKFSPDGRLLATAGDDKTVQLWDVTDPQRSSQIGAPMGGADGTIYSLAFSRDGGTLITANENHTARLWNVDDPAHPVPFSHPLAGHAGPVRAVAVSPDGRTAATTGDDRTVRLWNIAIPAAPVPLSGALAAGNDTVHALAFSPDGQMLAAASEDKSVRLWDVTDAAVPRPLGQPLTQHTGPVWSLAFSQDGRLLATGGMDSTVRLWNLSDRANPSQLGRPLVTRNNGVFTLDFSPDGETIATGSADSAVRLWSIPSTVLLGHTLGVNSLALNHDGTILATAADDRTVRLWNVASRDPRALSQLTGHDSYINYLAFSPNGQTLATASGDGTVRLWNVIDPARPVLVTPPLRLRTRYAGPVAFSPDGRLLVTGDDDLSVRVWNVADPSTPTPVGHSLTGHTGYVNDVAFSPDGRLLVTACSDQTILLWNVSDTGDAAPAGPPLTGHSGKVQSATFTRDGRTLITGASDGTVRLWDVKQPHRPAPLGHPLTGHSESVESVALGHDGHVLFTTSTDDTIRRWDITDPAEPKPAGEPLTGHGQTGRKLIVGPGTRYLLTTTGDAVVWRWNLDLNEIRKRICSKGSDALTQQIWQQRLAQLTYVPSCA